MTTLAAAPAIRPCGLPPPGPRRFRVRVRASHAGADGHGDESPPRLSVCQCQCLTATGLVRVAAWLPAWLAADRLRPGAGGPGCSAAAAAARPRATGTAGHASLRPRAGPLGHRDSDVADPASPKSRAVRVHGRNLGPQDHDRRGAPSQLSVQGLLG